MRSRVHIYPRANLRVFLVFRHDKILFLARYACRSTTTPWMPLIEDTPLLCFAGRSSLQDTDLSALIGQFFAPRSTW